MGFRARLTTGKLTLLSRTGTTSRTTDSERISRAGVVLLHGGKRKRSTRVVKSSVRHRTPFRALPAVASWQSSCQRSFVVSPSGNRWKLG